MWTGQNYQFAICWTSPESDFVCVEVFLPSQLTRVMLSMVSLPNHNEL